MSFWEVLALVSAGATILGVFLAVYAMLNNRTLKQEAASTREILNGIEHGQRENSAATRDLLSRIEQGQEDARKEMAEAIRYLADWIRAEGGKPRQTLRASS